MPEPDGGLDYYIYNYLLNPIADNICFISPNTITTFGLLLTIPLFLNIIRRESITVGIILYLIIYLLDCLDGAVARKCKNGSKYGALYDTTADFIKYVILLISIIMLYSSGNYLQLFIIIICVIHNIIFIKNIIGELKNKRSVNNNYFNNKLEKIGHDNGIVLNLLFILVIKFLF